MSRIAERSLNPEYVVENATKYHWPFSQPRLLNVINATSRYGFLVGFLSSIIISASGFYFDTMIYLYDFFAVIAFVILRGFIVPAVRRAQIKHVASESRKINKFFLIVSCIYMYSAMIRFCIATVLILINNDWDLITPFTNFIETVEITHLVIGAFISILPTILVLFPRDVSVKEFHFEVKRMWDERNSLSSPVQTEVEPVRYIREPNMVHGYYGQKQFAPRPVIELPPEELESIQEQISNNNQNNNKNNNKSNNTSNKKPKKGGKPKHLTPETGKENKSIWESQKSVRRPRR